ncbi:MAG TPA: hypothetical protein VFJ18_12100 [Pararhizobium sp.]|nr:hypothetical protein [Pararhizobium sp.]
MDDEKSIAQFKATGGPAFPAKWELPSGGNLSGPGMTLRDWLAGQALTARLGTGIVAMSDAATMAKYAYTFADAMLAERVKEAS